MKTFYQFLDNQCFLAEYQTPPPVVNALQKLHISSLKRKGVFPSEMTLKL